MEALTLVQNDRNPTLYAQAVDWERFINELEGQEWNIEGATILLSIRPRGGGDVVLEVDGEVVDAQSGWMSFEWPADALDLDVARYEGQVTLTIGGLEHTALINFWDTHEYDPSLLLPVSVKERFA